MAKSRLFVPFTLRFSLLNDQHVAVMNMLDELAETDQRSKNQILMDALEYYFRHSTEEETAGKSYVENEVFERRLTEEREKLRIEIYQDVIRFIAGNALSGGIKAVPARQFPEQMPMDKEAEDNDYSEFGDNGVRMKDVMKWS